MDEKDEKHRAVPPPPKGYEGGQPEIDRAKERKLVRKLDFHIIPVVMLLYLLSFLDRYVYNYIYDPIKINRKECQHRQRTPIPSRRRSQPSRITIPDRRLTSIRHVYIIRAAF